ncbi:MAG TPA: hypothetical protein VN541_02315 [Tepidisphaeraceae bacterium]|nr:hypothetical protein [Tepidisphaeraceae bacterium]
MADAGVNPLVGEGVLPADHPALKQEPAFVEVPEHPGHVELVRRGVDAGKVRRRLLPVVRVRGHEHETQR